jgi:hypothetical protein
LATYRLTVLVVYDELSRPLRESLTARWLTARESHQVVATDVEKMGASMVWRSVTCSCGEKFDAAADARRLWQEHVVAQPTRHPRLTVLIECPWCVSVWCGLAVAWSGLLWWYCTWWQLLTGGLAMAAVAAPVAVFVHPPKAEDT